MSDRSATPRARSDRSFASRSLPLRTLAATVGIALLSASCGGSEGPARRSTVPTGPLMPITVAMSWRGDLPCADCEAIRTTVTLHPDGTYRRDSAYLGTGEAEDPVVGEIGRFALDRSGERLTLHGTGEAPAHFFALADGNLLLLDQSGEVIDSELPYTLIHLPNPVRQEGKVGIVGPFTYFADAALLIECTGGIQFPVAMAGEYLALESAYLERGMAGAPLPVAVSGRAEERPAMEGGGTEVVLIIESFEILDTLPDCPALEMREDLAGREWELAWVWGDATDGGSTPGETPALRWDPESLQLTGNAGCNGFSARGVLRGSLLATSEAVSTRRFCEGVMEREARILSLFSNSLFVRIEEGELILRRRGEVAAVYRPAGG